MSSPDTVGIEIKDQRLSIESDVVQNDEEASFSYIPKSIFDIEKNIVNALITQVEDIYYSNTPETVREIFLPFFSLSIATLMNMIMLAAFIYFAYFSITSLHEAQYISIEESSDADCQQVPRGVSGVFYYSPMNGWQITQSDSSVFSMTFNKYYNDNNGYTEMINRAYSRYFSRNIFNQSIPYVNALVYSISCIYTIIDNNNNIVVARSVGNPVSLFSGTDVSYDRFHVYYANGNGTYLFNSSFIFNYNSNLNGFTYHPTADDPVQYLYRGNDRTMRTYTNSIDLSYTFSAIGANKRFIVDFDQFVGHTVSNLYTYKDINYLTRSYIDSRFPTGYIECATYPRTLCFVTYFTGTPTGTTNIYAMPVIKSDNLCPTGPDALQLFCSDAYIGLIFYTTVQNLVDDVFSYENNDIYDANIFKYNPGSVNFPPGTLVPEFSIFCRDCRRVLLFRFGNGLIVNSYTASITTLSQLTPYVWTTVSKTTPTDFVESYFKCQLTIAAAAQQGLGIAVGNATLAVSVVAIIIVPFLIYIFGQVKAGVRTINVKYNKEVREDFSKKLLTVLLDASNSTSDGKSTNTIAEDAQAEEMILKIARYLNKTSIAKSKIIKPSDLDVPL